jgi:hypothetical protein
MTTIAANPTVLKAVSASIGKDIPPFTAGKDKEVKQFSFFFFDIKNLLTFCKIFDF